MGGSIWLACGLVLFLTRRIGRRAVVRLLLAIVLVHLLIDCTLKPWFGRLRPPFAFADIRVIGDLPDTRSFPSGHAANAMAGALVLSATQPGTKFRWLIWVAAAVVSVARVYLGIHYPLDAVAGCTMGLLCGAIALSVPLPQRFPIRRATS